MNLSPLPTILFLAVTLFVFASIVQGLVVGLRGIRHANYTSVLYGVILGMFAWLSALFILGTNGFFAEFESFPPRLVLALVVPIGILVFLSFNKAFGELLDHLKLAPLIYLQTFRVFVEIVLWLAYKDEICPKQMTFEGWNFDILAGITAPIAGFLAFGGGRYNKLLAIIWNVLGLVLLFNIIGIAILSIPQIGVLTPPNTMLAYWPMVWLPGFVAPFAMMLHFFSIRQLLRKR